MALILMTVQEWSVQETALALMVLIRSHVFAIMALKEKTALVGLHVAMNCRISMYLKVKELLGAQLLQVGSTITLSCMIVYPEHLISF